ncbi:hypothetical protein C1H46_030117 [Malus baccata]|uniref:EF-hand domain-containing protein n=1 Tax=Malus baccata TaxID=106549 RepID=A0A540LCX8_MALBA|nr:hypothetical protein C1H46_030117 [Malus baccata]
MPMEEDAKPKPGRRRNACNPIKKTGPVSMDHVLLALGETKEQRELRIRTLFNFLTPQMLVIWTTASLPSTYPPRIEIADEELALFVERVDKENNGVITFEEWRDFLLLYPQEATIENIYHFLERVCLVDIGEQTVVPEVISKHDHASRYLIAGAVAGATSRTATAPLDRLKVILQVQTKRARIMPAIREIWGECGLLGFFRGNGLNVLKVAPESAIRFYTYEMLKSFIVHANGEEDKANVGTATRLVSGGLAGAVAQTVIYPVDLVKTRILWICVEKYGFRRDPGHFIRVLFHVCLGWSLVLALMLLLMKH